MATVIVFTHAAIGHVNPTLPIVSELVRRGEKVLYYSGQTVRARIEATGAEFRDVPWDASALESIAKPGFCDVASEILKFTESYLPQLQEEMRAAAPRYVLVDFMCTWGRYAARSLGIPVVAMSSSFALDPRMLPPKLLITLLEMGLSLERARKVFEMRRISRRLSERYGVEPLRQPIDLMSMDGDLVLTTTSRAFQPRAELFDERFQFIGPCFAPRGGEPAWTMPPLDERPVIYISLGTVFNREPTFYRNCLQAFSDGRYQVILSMGEHLKLSDLGPVPSNIHAFNYVSQLEVLKRAALFITHGGMNSTSEAIWHEVPLLVFPQMADQFGIAKRVEELGLGRRLSPRQQRPEPLRKAVDALMADPTVRERCKDIHRSFVEAGGTQRAVELLQAFGAGQPTRRAG